MSHKETKKMGTDAASSYVTRISGLALMLAVVTPSEGARYLVKLRHGSSADRFTRRMVAASNVRALNSELRAASSMGLNATRPLANLGIVVVDGNDESVKSVLKDHPLVDFYEREVTWKTSFADGDTPPSTQAAAPWLSDVLGLNEIEPATNVGYSGNKPVTVAVIDTGSALNHPYLSPSFLVNRAELNGRNNVDDDGNGYVDDVYAANVLTRDGNVNELNSDHGTHVAGLVKSIRDQAIPNYPAAAAVRILPIRFISASGVGSTSGAVEALEYALARGAKVVNASWGARGDEAFSRALYEAMASLYEKDVFFSVAAGNAEQGVANNNDKTPYYPANFPIPALMSVASLTPSYSSSGDYQGFYLSSFSNYGRKSVHIAAPGDYIDPDGYLGAWSANAAFESDGSLYVRKRGTSMAAPIVAGVAAVVRAINPSLTNYEVKKVLLDSAGGSNQLTDVKGSAYLRAAKAFARAATTVSRGERPASPSFEQASSAGSRDDEESSGGCGLVRDVGSNKKGDGPLGGNSVGLFFIGYLTVTLTRSLARRLRSYRVV